VSLTWASCEVGSNGLHSVECADDLIEADRAAAVRKKLDAIGWSNEAGVLVCRYGARMAAIWDDEEAGCWGWQVDGLPGDRASTICEAKFRCAEVLAQRC